MNINKQQRLMRIILAPVITEKSTMVADGVNQVLLKVVKDATKQEVKEAVEMLFEVKVKDVNILVQKGKKKRTGRYMGRRNDVKKAYVSLAAGEELNFGFGG